jgi:hypothetical protein
MELGRNCPIAYKLFLSAAADTTPLAAAAVAQHIIFDDEYH